MNVTVTDTDDAGFLTLFPASLSTPPTASNLNWAAGATIPNLTITKVPTSGSDNVKIFNAARHHQRHRRHGRLVRLIESVGRVTTCVTPARACARPDRAGATSSG